MCGGRKGPCTKPFRPAQPLRAMGSNKRRKIWAGCVVKRAAALCNPLSREVVKILFICKVMRTVFPENKYCGVYFEAIPLVTEDRGRSSPPLLLDVHHQATCFTDSLKVSAICCDCFGVDKALIAFPSSPSPAGMRVFPTACWSFLLFAGLSVHVG